MVKLGRSGTGHRHGPSLGFALTFPLELHEGFLRGRIKSLTQVPIARSLTPTLLTVEPEPGPEPQSAPHGPDELLSLLW